ncbi:MAG: hypothetical protein OEZ04_07685, partial [Nitrospinota bacterium]|nr:hypothetical protein [Nitrospinota bacterium]
RAMVSCLAINKDGTLALSGGYDRMVRLWDLYTGRCLRTFEGHEDTVNDVVFTPDSRHGVSCGWDGSIRSWSLESPSYRAPLMVSRVQSSEIVLSAGAAYEEKIERVKEALEMSDPVAALKWVREAREQHGFSRGAEALEAQGLLYNSLPRKALSGGWESKVMGGHTGPVNCVAVSFDCHMAVSCGNDRVVRVWDLTSFRERKILEGHSARVNHVAISHDSSLIVSAGGEGSVKVWDLSSGDLMDLKGHKGPVTKVDMTWDKKFVISGGSDRTVKIWDLGGGRIIRSLRAHQGDITALAVSSHGLILSGSEDRTARLWEISSGRTVRVFEGHQGAVCGALIGLDQTTGYTAGKDGKIIKWDLKNPDPLQVMEGHKAPITSLALTYDGNFLASSDEERTVRFWDVRTGENVRTFTGHASSINSVALTLDGKYAITCGDDKWIKVWTLDWELDEKQTTHWDEAARPWAVEFMAQRTPRLGELPEGRDPFEKEISSALTSRGKVSMKSGVEDYYTMLGYAGFGWLDRDGAESRLWEVSKTWEGITLDKSLVPTEHSAAEDIAVGERIVMKEESEKPPAGAGGLTRWLARLLGKERK